MVCKDSFTLTFTLIENFQWKAIQTLLFVQSAVPWIYECIQMILAVRPTRSKVNQVAYTLA